MSKESWWNLAKRRQRLIGSTIRIRAAKSFVLQHQPSQNWDAVKNLKFIVSQIKVDQPLSEYSFVVLSKRQKIEHLSSPAHGYFPACSLQVFDVTLSWRYRCAMNTIINWFLLFRMFRTRWACVWNSTPTRCIYRGEKYEEICEILEREDVVKLLVDG